MKIASAQISSMVGKINQNLESHYKMIDLASQNNVDLIMFPEMSITGYCREEGMPLTLAENDEILRKLKKLSVEKEIIITAGAPIKMKNKLHIGTFIFNPDNSTKIYTKQYLHDGEELYYESSFNNNPLLELENEKISFAICADIENPLHPKNANENKSTLYMPSIFYSVNGIDAGMEKLRLYAEKYSLNVLMSNYCGQHWGIESGGRSAFWTSNGELKAELNSTGEGLIIIEKEDNNWKTEIK